MPQATELTPLSTRMESRSIRLETRNASRERRDLLTVFRELTKGGGHLGTAWTPIRNGSPGSTSCKPRPLVRALGGGVIGSSATSSLAFRANTCAYR